VPQHKRMAPFDVPIEAPHQVASRCPCVIGPSTMERMLYR